MKRAYMKHPKLKRKPGEKDLDYQLRRKRDRAARRRAAHASMTKILKRMPKLVKPGQRVKLDAPLKIVHDWIADREIHEAHIVLRIDDYSTMSSDRGQFYPAVERTDDKMKAIWSSRQKAIDAATWAAQKFGRQYGVFKMVAIVETTTRPIRVVEV